MRRTDKPKPAPAPGFAAWLKEQEEAEFARGREARQQFEAVAHEVGALGYWLRRDEHTGRYLLYVAETSVAWPRLKGDLHFVRYVIEFDVHTQVVRCKEQRSSWAAPVAMLAKPWTLETGVRAYVKLIQERGDAPKIPRQEPEALDEPDGE